MSDTRFWQRLGRLRSHARTIAALTAGGTIIGAAIMIAQFGPPSASSRNVAATSVLQGGCNPYVVQAASLGTFDMGVCITDNSTGTTAYPKVAVTQVPAYMGTSCTIAIELWDDGGSSYGTPKLADCKVGTWPGNAFTANKQLTLHAFARLKICLVTNVGCMSYYLGAKQGDSPPIEVQPFLPPTRTTVATSTSVQAGVQEQPRPDPFDPWPLPPVDNQRRADCRNSANWPTTGFVESNGGTGWNQYTTGPGNRPGPAAACVDHTRQQGTDADQGLALVGWDDAMAKVDQWNSSGPNAPVPPLNKSRAVNRCHLIAAVLGGNGKRADNLVPCTASYSGSANQVMRVQERTLNGVVQATAPGEQYAGGVIYYQVTPNYADNAGVVSTIPSSITMKATLYVPGQLPQVIIQVTAQNTMRVKTQNNPRVVLQLGN